MSCAEIAVFLGSAEFFDLTGSHMVTVFRKKGSPIYWTAFNDGDGRRRYRSTKSKRKTDAISAATEMELASRRVGDGSEADRRILAILEEATRRALRKRLNGIATIGDWPDLKGLGRSKVG